MDNRDDPPAPDDKPSRSQQRREALAVLELAERLVALTPQQLSRLDLPEDVVAEIVQARRITSHIARKRQLGFLAKRMRRHEASAFAHARAALGEDRERKLKETAALHRLEAWRTRLLADDEAFGELIARHPAIDRQQMRTLIRQARQEQAEGKPPRAARELFRMLKTLDEAEATD